MSADDNTLPLPPSPVVSDVPHLYVINSDEGFLDLIRDILADERIHVTVEQMRPNVEVTLGNLRAAQPDLVLIDVVPYQQDAARLLEALAAAIDLQELPVMLASTRPQAAEALAQQYPQLVREVLGKPFEIADFFVKLRHLIGMNTP
jgi:CheY-like chemotaxis protein